MGHNVLKNRFTKLLAIFAIGLLVLGFLPTPKIQAFSGSGTGLSQGNEYIITTCSQLQEMADDLGAWYKLGNNIDCSGSASWNGNAGFAPVGDSGSPFHGVFEGADFTITGLTINRPTTDYVGLFGYIGNGGVAQSFRFKDASITGRDYVGAIAGMTLNAELNTIGIYGEVTGRNYVGGAVGDNGGGVVDMHAHVVIGGVPASGVGGGLVGENHGFTIHSYSTGLVPSGTGKGGLVGHDAGSGGIFGSFWDTQTSGHATGSYGTGKTTAELKNVDTFTLNGTAGLGSKWDFVDNPNNDIGTDDTWNINPLINQGYPYLVGQTPGLPDTFIINPPQSPTNSADLTFEFDSNVPGSTFECKAEPDQPAYAPCTSPYVLPTSTEGTYTFAVKATNADGVADQTPAQKEVIIDTTKPGTFITNLGSTPVTTLTTNFILTSDEAATFECNLDGTGYGVCNPFYSTPSLAEGQHNLSVRAIDTAGNIDATPASYTWLVDTLAPSTSLTMTDPPVGKATATFEFTSNEMPSTYECKLDTASYQACTSPYTTPALTGGGHTLLVRATDGAGNVETPPASSSWAVVIATNGAGTPANGGSTVQTSSAATSDKNTSVAEKASATTSADDTSDEENEVMADASGAAETSNGASTSSSDSEAPAATGNVSKWRIPIVVSLLGVGLIFLYIAYLDRRKQK